MIRVQPEEEPTHFQDKVRTPGNEWLKGNPQAQSRDFPAHWKHCEDDLRRVFGERCGYSAMYTSAGVVDHYVPAASAPEKAYEWENYRWADMKVNALKTNQEVLDPFAIEEGWFEIVSLATLELRETNAIPEEVKGLASWTLDRLRLRNGYDVIRARQTFMRQFREKKIRIEALRELAPLLAAAVERNVR